MSWAVDFLWILNSRHCPASLPLSASPQNLSKQSQKSAEFTGNLQPSWPHITRAFLWKCNASLEIPAAIQVAKTEAEHIRLSKTTATSSHFNDRPSMSFNNSCLLRYINAISNSASSRFRPYLTLATRVQIGRGIAERCQPDPTYITRAKVDQRPIQYVHQYFE